MLATETGQSSVAAAHPGAPAATMREEVSAPPGAMCAFCTHDIEEDDVRGGFASALNAEAYQVAMEAPRRDADGVDTYVLLCMTFKDCKTYAARCGKRNNASGSRLHAMAEITAWRKVCCEEERDWKQFDASPWFRNLHTASKRSSREACEPVSALGAMGGTAAGGGQAIGAPQDLPDAYAHYFVSTLLNELTQWTIEQAADEAFEARSGGPGQLEQAADEAFEALSGGSGQQLDLQQAQPKKHDVCYTSTEAPGQHGGVKVTYTDRLSSSAAHNDAEWRPFVTREPPPAGGVGPPADAVLSAGGSGQQLDLQQEQPKEQLQQPTKVADACFKRRTHACAHLIALRHMFAGGGPYSHHHAARLRPEHLYLTAQYPDRVGGRAVFRRGGRCGQWPTGGRGEDRADWLTNVLPGGSQRAGRTWMRLGQGGVPHQHY